MGAHKIKPQACCTQLFLPVIFETHLLFSSNKTSFLSSLAQGLPVREAESRSSSGCILCGGGKFTLPPLLGHETCKGKDKVQSQPICLLTAQCTHTCTPAILLLPLTRAAFPSLHCTAVFLQHHPPLPPAQPQGRDVLAAPSASPWGCEPTL